MLSASGQAEGDRTVQAVEDSDWPVVDILIPYCGEGDEMILNTAKAACACDYPSGLLRAIILDDSHSRELAQRVEAMKKEWPNLSYASRNVDVKTHSKAANLNFGIRYLQSLEEPQAPYVAVLDADMIPEPMWLRSVLPHVLNNPRAALACPMQRYYNLPRGDPLGILSDLQPIECMMRLQDFSNNSWCTGSGFVIKSSALESIGRFPEDSLQEDALTSNYLSAAGWYSLFVPGSLQWGRGPDTMAAYLKQSQRWAVGIISVAQFVRSGKAKKLPREVRLNLTLWGAVMGAASFIWTFALVALPLCVMNRKPLIVPSQQGSHHLRRLMRIATLDFCTRTLYHTLMSSIVDFRMPIFGLFTAIWTQPWRAAIVLRYFVVPKLLGRDPPNFTPTGTSADGEAERAARTRGSRVACCKSLLWDCGAWIHLVVLLFSAAGAVAWLRAALGGYFDGQGPRDVGSAALRGVAWPPVLLLWAALAKAAWLPVSYAIRPPSMSARDGFMVRDSKRGVEYPSDEVKKDHMRRQGQWPFAFKCLAYILALVVTEML